MRLAVERNEPLSHDRPRSAHTPAASIGGVRAGGKGFPCRLAGMCGEAFRPLESMQVFECVDTWLPDQRVDKLIRPVRFIGSAREDLRAFPLEVRRELGEQLMRVQSGLAPRDFKPMSDVGAGVYEIRVHIGGAWRLLYVAKFVDAIYVLHAFEKKTQRTPKSDLDLAAKRYRLIGGKS